MTGSSSEPGNFRLRRRRSLAGRIGVLIFRLAVAWVVLSVVVVVALRWLPPPMSAFMAQRQAQAWWTGDRAFRLRYDWRAWEEVSPDLRIAVVASEDQKFPRHNGFDW